jgi:hypothetical protein
MSNVFFNNPTNPVLDRIAEVEAIEPAKRSANNIRRLAKLTQLSKNMTRRINYQREVNKVKEKNVSFLTPENKELLRQDEEYKAKEERRIELSQCIFDTLDEKEKAQIVATMKKLTESFTPDRKFGEGLGVVGGVAASSISATTGSIATLATAGVVASTGPFAIPITVGLIAIGAIAGFYYRQKALNTELQGNLIAIKGEVERLYFIYKVIERIAKEKNLNINTFLKPTN